MKVPIMISGRRYQSIRFRLLSMTSTVTVCFVVVLVLLDYRREVQHHFTEKQSDLYEEAKTVLPGIVHTREHGREAFQKYIDSVCNRMDEKHSPSHRIAVQIDNEFYEAYTSSDEKRALEGTIKNPSTMSDSETLFGGSDELLAGAYSDHNISVLVTENVANLRSAILDDELFRIAGIILMGISATVIVHLMLVQLVSKPLEIFVEKVRAVGKGDYDNPIGEFGTLELNILSREINHMSAALANAEVDRNSQLQKARKIQQNLLPNGVVIPGVNIGQIYCPAEEVGGDYLDILPQGNNRWLICVADATGHGVPAAMSSAMLKTLLLQFNDGDKSPATILREINTVFMQVHVFGDFASVVLLQLDLNARTLTYQPVEMRSHSPSSRRILFGFRDSCGRFVFARGRSSRSPGRGGGLQTRGGTRQGLPKVPETQPTTPPLGLETVSSVRSTHVECRPRSVSAGASPGFSRPHEWCTACESCRDLAANSAGPLPTRTCERNSVPLARCGGAAVDVHTLPCCEFD